MDPHLTSCTPSVPPIYKGHTLSKGKKNADALEDLLPAFNATALPCQSITGEPLEPPLVPDAAWKVKNATREIKQNMNHSKT